MISLAALIFSMSSHGHLIFESQSFENPEKNRHFYDVVDFIYLPTILTITAAFCFFNYAFSGALVNELIKVTVAALSFF